MSFSFVSLSPSNPTFSLNAKIKMTLSVAVLGTLEMKPFPWTAVTPSAHILKARTPCGFDLPGFEYFLIITQCQIRVPRLLVYLQHCIYSALDLRVFALGWGSPFNVHICMIVSAETVLG